MTSSDDTSVQVALRVRPQSSSEKIDLCHVCTSVTVGHPQVILGKDKAFTYDFVYDINSIQTTIYDEIARPLIEGCYDGYNATILAYGQTGSGKTYTMGTSFDMGVPDDLIGIIPRAATHLFEGIQKRRDKAEEDGKPLPEFKVSAQFLELYNEEIIDLLDIQNKGRKTIKVHEDHNGNIYMTGVVAKNIVSADDCMNLLEEGAVSRTTAATNMNATSSRSHAIFTIFVKHYRLAPTGGNEDGGEEFETLNAKFNFVDLAGSERLKRTGATGDRAKEGISINQGLLSLGNVISALGDKAKRGSHVPYRDSKLTRLLQDSLGGNSRTLMIACVSPSDRDFMETLNTLKYANRARNIKNKVMVNQDKASKQIAALRQEIQELTVELLEYKQGKRVADSSGEHMTDTFHELDMLKNENDHLRMRIKALQQNIDSQTIQLTELKVTSALAHFSTDEQGTIEEMVKNYEKQIQELSNKVRESEAMSVAATRRAQTVSRMAMSPGYNHETEDTFSLLEQAKEDVRKEKRKKKLIKKKVKHERSTTPTVEDVAVIPTEDTATTPTEDLATTPTDETSRMKEIPEDADENTNVVVISDDDEKDTDRLAHQNGERENSVDNDNENENPDGDEDEDEEGEDDEEELLSNTDSDTDDELNASLREEVELQNKIAELDTDIDLKQKLIEQLENSQQKMVAMKHNYEEKFKGLHDKIRSAEVERDEAIKSVGTVDSVARDKAEGIRKRYEKKLIDLQKELKTLQRDKKKHVTLMKQQAENANRLKTYRNEINEMKQSKVKLMRAMREEHSKYKLQEGKLSRQMETVLKENRKKDVELKRLKDEKKQKNLILKRKQEELNAMRKQAKPISGNITSRNSTRGRPNNLQLQFQSQANQNLNSTFVIADTKNKQLPSTPTKRRIPSPTKGIRSPAVSKKAKYKWEILERKVTDLSLRMKNIAQMENDMERWVADRDRVRKQLESAIRRKEDAEKNATSQDENLVKELINQVEGLEAHMEFIQENIAESQNNIADIADEGEGINPNDIISTSTLTECRYLLEHFYSKSMETAQDLANKDAAYKEIQIKLEAMEKHCEVQQQLLQHACNLEYGAGYMNMDDDDLESVPDLPDIVNVTNTRKTRRKTALPEELLHPKEPKNNKLPVVIDLTEENTPVKETESNDEDDKQKLLSETFQIDDKTLQKLMDLEKTLKDRKKMPPPPPPGDKNLSTRSIDSNRARSGSFTERSETTNASNKTLPNNFLRNTRMTRSARPFNKSASMSSLKPQRSLKGSSNPSSNKNSPALERRSTAEPTSVSTDLDSSDVFKRLTSGLPQESDPDLGQILSCKLSPGHSDLLICQYTATGHNNAVLSLDVMNNLMVTGSKDRTAKIWDLNTNEEIRSLPKHGRDVTVVKFNKMRNQLFTVYQSTIKLWDLRDGSLKKTLGGGIFQTVGEANIMALDLDKDGNTLYSAVGNVVKMYDLRANFTSIGKLTGHTGAVSCLLVSDTGHNHDNVITGSKDHSIKIFEVVDEVAPSQIPRQNLEPPHYDGVQSLAMKNNHLFSGSRDNTIKKWNFRNHDLDNHLTAAHKDWVMSLNFVPNMDVLISADRRGVLKLWHIDTCKQLGEMVAHGKAINSIKCSSDAIFTASSDRLVRIWKPSQLLEDKVMELDQE